MALIIYLLDKSALAARHGEAARAKLEHRIITGQLAVCEMTALEILYSARSGQDYTKLSSGLNAYRWLPTTEMCMQRALAVQALLAVQGKHRRPLPDLIIAATAEHHGATVLHADHDFEIIAAATGQPIEHIEEAK